MVKLKSLTGGRIILLLNKYFPVTARILSSSQSHLKSPPFKRNNPYAALKHTDRFQNAKMLNKDYVSHGILCRFGSCVDLKYNVDSSAFLEF